MKIAEDVLDHEIDKHEVIVCPHPECGMEYKNDVDGEEDSIEKHLEEC